MAAARENAFFSFDSVRFSARFFIGHGRFIGVAKSANINAPKIVAGHIISERWRLTFSCKHATMRHRFWCLLRRGRHWREVRFSERVRPDFDRACAIYRFAGKNSKCLWTQKLSEIMNLKTSVFTKGKKSVSNFMFRL